MKSKHIGKDKSLDSGFMKMLDESFSFQEQAKPGSHFVARIANVKNSDYVFIQTEHVRGVIPREEFLDDRGALTVNAGEKINVFFRGMSGGENIFTTLPTGKIRGAILRSAMSKGIPVPGKVIKSMKGGFEVLIGDMSAFCPASQMPQGEDMQGKKLPFIVMESDEKNTVVSHRQYLDRIKERMREQQQNSLQEGDIVQGRVIKLTNFGAFVDIGGIEGLIPISECSFTRIQHPSEVLKRDDEIRVKVQQLNWKENRITLSLKALQANPWQGTLPFKEGDILEGKVESIKNFGLFVKILDGFTGLVPNSESGVPRGKALEKEFQINQTLRVMVQSVDRDREKISLSVQKVQDADTREEYTSYMANQGDSAKSGQISSFGKQLMKSLNSPPSGD